MPYTASSHSLPSDSYSPCSSSGLPAAGFGAALVPVLFTYGGWQQTNFIAEEIIEPERILIALRAAGFSDVRCSVTFGIFREYLARRP